ncbi:MAG: type II toxin-antitoxin system RelE/ParE family toxin [Candidatus Solibacter sp.]
MSPYVLGAEADSDLEEIWDYIAEDSVRAADRWIERLFETFEALARAPGMGHRRPDLTPLPVLFWPVGRYLIIYRATHGTVEIVAVTQGARNIPVFLSRRLPSGRST